MEVNQIYPKGGTNKMWEPLHIEVSGLNLPGITIQGRTWGHDGSEIKVIHEDQKMSHHRGDFVVDFNYDLTFSVEAAKDINLIMDIAGLPLTVSSDELNPVMKILRNKCESRLGNLLPGSDYEVLVTFKE